MLYEVAPTGGTSNVLEAPAGGFQVDEEPQLPALN
jgi:hypothetical protein